MAGQESSRRLSLDELIVKLHEVEGVKFGDFVLKSCRMSYDVKVSMLALLNKSSEVELYAHMMDWVVGSGDKEIMGRTCYMHHGFE